MTNLGRALFIANALAEWATQRLCKLLTSREFLLLVISL